MIRKIVLTGGPGSGKTTVIESIKKNFGGKYKVIVADETASHLMGMGLRPFGDNPIPLLDFQELVLKGQLSKEEVIDIALNYIPDNNIIVIYDRGLIDNMAYISEDEFNLILNRLEKKYTVNDFLERYDLIINLVSREDFYTTENNPERTEKIGEALSLGKKTLESWMGHKNIKIVSPKDDINDKIKEVLNYINEVLDEEQVKSQKKYFVNLDNTNMEYLNSISKVANIEQTYLDSPDNIEKRLRIITMNNVSTYNYTIHKINDNGIKVKISDKSISKETYEELLEFKDKNKKTIIKDRYYFPYKDKYFTLDIIDNYGILEVNITDNNKIEIPPFIDIIEDVSENEDFLNINIANKNSKQFTKK